MCVCACACVYVRLPEDEQICNLEIPLVKIVVPDCRSEPLRWKTVCRFLASRYFVEQGQIQYTQARQCFPPLFHIWDGPFLTFEQSPSNALVGLQLITYITTCFFQIWMSHETDWPGRIFEFCNRNCRGKVVLLPAVGMPSGEDINRIIHHPTSHLVDSRAHMSKLLRHLCSVPVLHKEPYRCLSEERIRRCL